MKKGRLAKALNRELRTFIAWYRAMRLWWWKRHVNRSIRVLDELDWHLMRIGWTRQERRRFWREFTSKQEKRTQVLNQITQ